MKARPFAAEALVQRFRQDSAGVHLKDVDLRINLEELAFFLGPDGR